jgi:DNA-binding response OmpR family regulator
MQSMMKKILVLHPDELMRESLRVILSGDGHQVQAAECIEEVASESSQFDLILAGSWPEQLVNNRRQPKPRVIMLSSAGAEEEISQNEVVLARPFSLADLRAAVAGTSRLSRPAFISQLVRRTFGFSRNMAASPGSLQPA